MKLLQFRVVQTQDFGLVRQVEAEFGDELRTRDRDAQLASFISFRVSIEYDDFEREATVHDCLLASLVEVKKTIDAEVARLQPTQGAA